MPAYEYILKVGKKEVGRVTLALPVVDRDAVRVARSPLPKTLRVSGGIGGNATLDALSRIESRIGSTAMKRGIGFPVETVKRIWGNHAARHAKTKDE